MGKETRCSLTCIRSTIKLKAQRSTVSLQPRVYLHYFTFLWKNSHYRTIDFIWNLFLRSSLKAKAKVGRSGCISYNISLHIISQWHSYTLPCLPPQTRVRIEPEDLSTLTTIEHNFCLKSGLIEYSPLPEPQNYPNLLLHRKFNFLKPLR